MTAVIIKGLLAACFGLAAIGKLYSGAERFGRELERYRLPFGVTGKRAALLIITLEMCVAFLLLTPLYAVGAALGALLAAGFGFAVSGVLARGERFACECFGAMIRITASARLFTLDLLLFAAALFIVQDYLRGPSSSSPAAQLFFISACVLVVGSGGQAARIAMRRRSLFGLATGRTAPTFSARTLDGNSVSSFELYAGQAVLIFVTPGCAACDALLSGIARKRNGQAEFLVVGTSDEAGMRRLMDVSQLPASRALDGADAPRVRRLFRMRASPAALVLAGGHVSRKLIPANAENVSLLFGESNGRR